MAGSFLRSGSRSPRRESSAVARGAIPRREPSSSLHQRSALAKVDKQGASSESASEKARQAADDQKTAAAMLKLAASEFANIPPAPHCRQRDRVSIGLSDATRCRSGCREARR